MRVCVYAISKNESKHAARWMASMAEADGIYVLDTGSQDGTPGLLRGLGAHVYEEKIEPWRFDEARNRSLSYLPEDAQICVCTDLDEVFRPGWRKALEEVWIEGAKMRVRYPYVWSHGPDGEDGVSFLLDKVHSRHGFFWTGPVHETLSCEGECIWAEAPGCILDHWPDGGKSRAQYLPLLELAVREDPENDRNMHYLGREYMYRGEYEKAIETLVRHLSMPRSLWKDERCASMRYIARCCGACGRQEEAEGWLLRAAAEAPYLREPWIEWALHAYGRDDWPAVLLACRRALRIRERPLSYISEPQCWSALPHDLLSLAEYHIGSKKEALAQARLALEIAPQDERIRDNCAIFEKEAALDRGAGDMVS